MEGMATFYSFLSPHLRLSRLEPPAQEVLHGQQETCALVRPNSAGTGLRQQLRRPAHECLLLSGSDLPESGVFSSGVEPGLRPRFGVKPGIPLISGRADRTEVDMRPRSSVR